MTHLRARARRDAKWKKKRKTGCNSHTKRKTARRKQTKASNKKKLVNQERTNEQLVQVSGFAKKEKKTRVSPDGGGRGMPVSIKARADGGGDAGCGRFQHARPGVLCIIIVPIDWCPRIDAQGFVWSDFR